VRDLLWAVGGDLIKPVDQLCVPATLLDQPINTIAASASAFLTVDVQHIELADKIAEYDCAVAGHASHVAFMLRGVTRKVWKLLKINENILQHAQHEIAGIV
jgi:hypothetical protein